MPEYVSLLDVLALDEEGEVEALGAAAVVEGCWGWLVEITAAAVVGWGATIVVGSAGTMIFW